MSRFYRRGRDWCAGKRRIKKAPSFEMSFGKRPQLWEQHNRSADRLWTGTAFKEFQLWRERYSGGLTQTEEAFAQAMVQHAERTEETKTSGRPLRLRGSARGGRGREHPLATRGGRGPSRRSQ